ncbi:MAG: hypothetical protein AAF253_05455 [Pseudomonadota bacterium]
MRAFSIVFPQTTNPRYSGSSVAIFILGLAVLGTVVPACIHTFLPDGGANVIAGMGLDLESAEGRRVVGLMAWAGVTQLAWGLVLLAVLVRYRDLIPLVLGLLTLERILHCWHFWGPKSDEHHPPEAYMTVAMIVLFGLGFALSLRQQKTGP